MSSPDFLSPDLREAARQLIATGRIRAETDPHRYKAALAGRKELTDFFREELGWTVETLDVARLVRLHKRRSDPPADRGPWLLRDGRPGPMAPPVVLVLVTLICEQLWRRPRVTLRELLQAIAQVCAAEAPSGRLPPFRVVAGDATSKREAQQNRQHLVDALKLLEAEGTVTVDADLDRAATDEDSDLVVTAMRDRLAAKLSSLSPMLLELSELPAAQHAAALSAEFLADRPDDDLDDPAAMTVQDRRLQAVRRLVDDPAASPLGDGDQVPYLHTISGRDRALTVTTSLGLATTVRRDWWEVTDPSGLASGTGFPSGRRVERQAALALLASLPRRHDPSAPLSLADITLVLEEARASLPRWAAAYDGRLHALARAAAGELAAAGLLHRDEEQADQWLPTPGIHLWRVRVRQPEPDARAGSGAPRPGEAASVQPSGNEGPAGGAGGTAAVDEPGGAS
jgi:uncharacterized protein (TIGR02678 family)